MSSCASCRFGRRCDVYLSGKDPVLDKNGKLVQCRYLPTPQYKQLSDWCGQHEERRDWDA